LSSALSKLRRGLLHLRIDARIEYQLQPRLRFALRKATFSVISDEAGPEKRGHLEDIWHHRESRLPSWSPISDFYLCQPSPDPPIDKFFTYSASSDTRCLCKRDKERQSRLRLESRLSLIPATIEKVRSDSTCYPALRSANPLST
jgi:hypothetical protein